MNIDLRDQLKQRKQAYVQDEILSSAARLFAEKTFRAITINDIAASLGYTKSVVYYYFKNKNEILWQIFLRMTERYLATINEVLEQPLSPEDKLKQIIYRHAMNVMTQKEWTAIFFRDESELQPEQLDYMRKHKREYDSLIEAVFQEGVDTGVFKPIPVHIAVSGFLGMCNWLHTWYNDQGPLSAEEIADHYAALLSAGYMK
ncbi:TetR/AcrR family transcriptional regulator [Pseudomonas putida]